MSPSSPLGHRIAERFWDPPGGGGSGAWGDWNYLCYDERWRLVAEFDGSADPDEPHTQYVHHNAGVDGMGGSSYIDAVVLRDRDTDATPGGGSPDERRYYVQNWRSDAVALTPELEPDGDPSMQMGAEMVRYTPYGTPIGINPADFNPSREVGDGVLNSSDSTDFFNAYAAWTGGGSYDVRVDWFRFDETKDSADFLGFNNAYAGPARGRGTLSGIGNRLGYAGYVFDDAIGMYHCRHRVYHPELGRWTRRDPAEHGADNSLYTYVLSSSPNYVDTLGNSGTFVPCLGTFAGIASRPCNEDDEDPNCPGNILLQCKNDPAVQRAEQRMNQACNGSSLCPSGWKLRCRDSQTKTCCKSCVIYIQPGLEVEGQSVVCSTLAHEMLHAADFCQRGEQGCEFAGACGKFADCRDRICSEARAHQVSCCDLAQHGVLYDNCMQNAKNENATNAVCPGCNKEDIWDNCLLNKDDPCGNPGIVPPLPEFAFSPCGKFSPGFGTFH